MFLTTVPLPKIIVRTCAVAALCFFLDDANSQSRFATVCPPTLGNYGTNSNAFLSTVASNFTIYTKAINNGGYAKIASASNCVKMGDFHLQIYNNDQRRYKILFIPNDRLNNVFRKANVGSSVFLKGRIGDSLTKSNSSYMFLLSSAQHLSVNRQPTPTCRLVPDVEAVRVVLQVFDTCYTKLSTNS